MNYCNKRTRTTASVLGVLLGMAGILNHGIFEILQGNTRTNGLFIEAIGKAHRFWVHGTEAAFTLIPNFLITGICVLIVGSILIFWSIKYIHIKRGTTIFLMLLILLTLVGGGIGFILVFVPTWAFSTRINKSLAWWGKKFSPKVRKILLLLWPYSLALTAASWFILMELGIFGYFPGQDDPDTILNIVFVFLFSSAGLASLTFVCAIAGDIEERNKS